MAAALLIGPITHARQEWESLSSLLTLKVVLSYPYLHVNNLG